MMPAPVRAAARTVVYVNRKHRFRFVYPAKWKPYLLAGRPYANARKEWFFPFRFRYGGKTYEEAFTVVRSPWNAARWRKEYEGSPFAFLAYGNGGSFSYVLPEEPPAAFLKPDGSDYDYVKFGKQLRLLGSIVNGAPKAFRSFRLLKK